jgi:diacylglycerol O-acyltransferase / wax synthase
VHGLTEDRTALVIVFHHVLADGIGGLAVLGHLVDGNPSPPGAGPPQAPPTARQLATDAARTRARALLELPGALRRFAAGVGQLRSGGVARAPRTALNHPTGSRRHLAVARADLAAVRGVAHAHGGTVNDVVLAAVAGALRAFLLATGERHDRFVVSIPVSGHRADEADPVRNRTGVVPVPLPAAGGRTQRLEATSRRTRAVKAAARDATAGVLEPLFVVLGRLGVVRWYINHQRRVNTFVTNLRGPAEPLTFLGAPVIDLLPVNSVAGNVTVAFGALSYAGTLAITVVADPDVCADVHGLAAELQRELDAYTGVA